MGMDAWERSKRVKRARFEDPKSARQVESESESDPWRSECCRGRNGP